LSLCEFRECNDSKQTNKLALELLGSEPRVFEAVTAIEYLKRHESQGTITLPTAFFKEEVEDTSGDKILCYIWNKENFLHQWKQSVIVPVSNKIRMQILVGIKSYFYHEHTKVYPTFLCQG